MITSHGPRGPPLETLLDEGDPEELFELYSEIAQGAYGQVYKARYLKDDTECALKIIALGEDETFDDLKVEIALLKQCNHKNIAKYIGGWKKENELFIAMELYDGGSLDEILSKRKRGFREDHIQYIAKEVLNGLNYLHKNNVIHRDIKGANIMMTKKGDLKLIDFGVSVIVCDNQKRFSLIGSPHFMAPEVIYNRDFPSAYDFKADIWSLGVTLINVAEDRVPHYDQPAINAMRQITKSDPPRLSEDKSWSPEFKDFINKCLQKNPGERLSAEILLKHPFLSSSPQTRVIIDLIEHKEETLRKAKKKSMKEITKLRTQKPTKNPTQKPKIVQVVEEKKKPEEKKLEEIKPKEKPIEVTPEKPHVVTKVINKSAPVVNLPPTKNSKNISQKVEIVKNEKEKLAPEHHKQPVISPRENVDVKYFETKVSTVTKKPVEKSPRVEDPKPKIEDKGRKKSEPMVLPIDSKGPLYIGKKHSLPENSHSRIVPSPLEKPPQEKPHNRKSNEKPLEKQSQDKISHENQKVIDKKEQEKKTRKSKNKSLQTEYVNVSTQSRRSNPSINSGSNSPKGSTPRSESPLENSPNTGSPRSKVTPTTKDKNDNPVKNEKVEIDHKGSSSIIKAKKTVETIPSPKKVETTPRTNETTPRTNERTPKTNDKSPINSPKISPRDNSPRNLLERSSGIVNLKEELNSLEKVETKKKLKKKLIYKRVKRVKRLEIKNQTDIENFEKDLNEEERELVMGTLRKKMNKNRPVTVRPKNIVNDIQKIKEDQFLQQQIKAFNKQQKNQGKDLANLEKSQKAEIKEMERTTIQKVSNFDSKIKKTVELKESQDKHDKISLQQKSENDLKLLKSEQKKFFKTFFVDLKNSQNEMRKKQALNQKSLQSNFSSQLKMQKKSNKDKKLVSSLHKAHQEKFDNQLITLNVEFGSLFDNDIQIFQNFIDYLKKISYDIYMLHQKREQVLLNVHQVQTKNKLDQILLYGKHEIQTEATIHLIQLQTSHLQAYQQLQLQQQLHKHTLEIQEQLKFQTKELKEKRLLVKQQMKTQLKKLTMDKKNLRKSEKVNAKNELQQKQKINENEYIEQIKKQQEEQDKQLKEFQNEQKENFASFQLSEKNNFFSEMNKLKTEEDKKFTEERKEFYYTSNIHLFLEMMAEFKLERELLKEYQVSETSLMDENNENIEKMITFTQHKDFFQKEVLDLLHNKQNILLEEEQKNLLVTVFNLEKSKDKLSSLFSLNQNDLKKQIQQILPETNFPLYNYETLLHQKEILTEKQKKESLFYNSQYENSQKLNKESNQITTLQIQNKISHLESFLLQQQNDTLLNLLKKFQNEFQSI
eukprot:TRINITY_DN4847_c0_g1_i1.p1 TRINITY_DN4847_c0_g1~~TRINITY_DN4847_c0_g1_i1.p1  ORF type:complete len:1332 (-),score=508.21 TRINITY_DN4847_c0_g1_i1:46-4041(-)